jgi:hypothetical protein
MISQQLLTAATILTLVSCGSKQSSADNKPTIKSFELNPTNDKDTINIVDSKGRKQGIWLTPLKNPNDNIVVMSDTIIYRNDTVISTSKK